MKVLVTGGAGFIGSHLVDRLIDEGHQVLVVDNLSTGCRDFIHPQADFVQMDIRDAALRDLFMSFRPDYVFHEAAQVMVTASMEDPQNDCDINLMGLIHLLNCCRDAGVKKILMPSSAAVYGDLDTLPLTETMQGVPSSFYGLTKLTSESYLRLYYEAFGLPYICYRYANVYGPRQGSGGEGGVVSIFGQRIAKGLDITVYGDGKQTRDFIYVGDVVNANMAGLQSEDLIGVYNVSTNVGTSVLDLIFAFEELAGVPVTVHHKEERPGDIRHSRLSTEKSVQAFGVYNNTQLLDGLRKTYAYFLEEVSK